MLFVNMVCLTVALALGKRRRRGGKGGGGGGAGGGGGGEADFQIILLREI